MLSTALFHVLFPQENHLPIIQEKVYIFVTSTDDTPVILITYGCLKTEIYTGFIQYISQK